MEDKNNNQTPKPINNNGTNKDDKQLQNSENGWTVDDLMELCPSLTRKEAEIANKMGW